jgi:hypothetical protein
LEHLTQRVKARGVMVVGFLPAETS